MNSHCFDSFDREYLAELIEAFPVDPPILIEEALKQLKDRAQQWSPFEFVDRLNEEPVEFSLPNIFPVLPLFLHQQMFKNILGNAGCYRDSRDALKGHVEFGLPIKKINDNAQSSNSRFNGFAPKDIKQGVEKAIEHLVFTAADPVQCAAKFYQQFVRVHPFYDGNGRIGRYMVEVYLYRFGRYVRWEDMKRNNRWLRQLNHCHKRMTALTMKKSYPFATEWWVYHFGKFVSVLELDPNEEQGF